MVCYGSTSANPAVADSSNVGPVSHSLLPLAGWINLMAAYIKVQGRHPTLCSRLSFEKADTPEQRS